MNAPESILQKIKSLQSLGNSPNVNEAQAARTLAAKLIVKYNITEEDLKSIADKAPAYGEDEKLFETSYIVSWMTHLALAISHKYDCQIVQETITPVGDGETYYNYFVYGAPEDVEITKFVWAAFSKKVEDLILTNCSTRGPIYVHSYTEGVVQSIKMNLQFEDFELPKIKKSLTVVETVEVKPDAITPEKVEREKPTGNKYDVNSDSLIKDIMAYFKGVEDGKNIRLQDVIDQHHANIQTQASPVQTEE